MDSNLGKPASLCSDIKVNQHATQSCCVPDGWIGSLTRQTAGVRYSQQYFMTGHGRYPIMSSMSS